MHLLPMSPDQWEWDEPEGGDKRIPQAMQLAVLSLPVCAHQHTQQTQRAKDAEVGVGKICFYSLRTKAGGVGVWGENLGLKTLPELAYTLVHHSCPVASLHLCQFPSPPYIASYLQQKAA